MDGNPRLRKRSRPVEEITPKILELLDDMAQTMKHADGAGLAAVQVGILRRVVVIDAGTGLIELINPVVVETSGVQEFHEGCLSIPGKQGLTHRPARVCVKAQDRNGNPITVEGTELLAVALCHETDHLDGKLYTDIAEGDLWEVAP
jgi:peptide deformylase